MRRVAVGSCLHGEFQLVDAGRGRDLQGLEYVPLRFRQLGALSECAGRAGEGADVDLVQFAAQLGPGPAAGVLGDPGQEQGEPAEDDVGAEAVFSPVPGQQPRQGDYHRPVSPVRLRAGDLAAQDRDSCQSSKTSTSLETSLPARSAGQPNNRTMSR